MSTATANPAFPRFVRLSHLRKLSECEQVAAVCYRIRGDEIEFLLVRTRGGKRWTFPKGSAEAGLTHAQAAALEAFEEAGVHGRIEEDAFTRYLRRAPGRRSSYREPPTTAHLCEVLRLGPPKESKRHRTWFSVEEARRRLREGRERVDGAEFVRVIDRAEVRIQREECKAHTITSGTSEVRFKQAAPRAGGIQGEALQKVKFDFTEVCGSGVSRTPAGVRHLIAAARITPPPATRETLPCEVLEFASLGIPHRRLFPLDKSAKEPGTGGRNS